MADDTPAPGPSRGERFDRVLGWVVTGIVLFQYVDMASGGRARGYVSRVVAHTRRLVTEPHAPQPSPVELSALHAEASRITRDAAEKGGPNA